VRVRKRREIEIGSKLGICILKCLFVVVVMFERDVIQIIYCTVFVLSS
jgi:hypothetical protein